MPNNKDVTYEAAMPFRVLIDGAEVAQAPRWSDALGVGYELASARPGVAVDVVGGDAVRITFMQSEQEDPQEPPEPETPEEPTDPEPVDEEPETPTDPEEPGETDPEPEPEQPGDEEPEPVEEPPPPPQVDRHPFYDIVATMQPGEFRRVPAAGFPPGVDSMERMNHTNWFDRSQAGTIGVGWTDRHVFDPATGRLFNILLREQYGKSVTWLEKDLTMNGVPAPEEAGLSRRRPFNRLCQGPDGKIYFAPSQPNTQIGRLTRFHPETPHIWEDAGAPVIPQSNIGGSQGDGSFAMIYHFDLGAFLMLCVGPGKGDTSPQGVWDYQGGKVWMWREGMATWEMIGRVQSCGFSGAMVYNHVHKEVGIFGGSANYGNPHPLAGQCMATVDAEGDVHRHGPTGLFISAGNRRVSYHPVTGDYIVMDQSGGRQRVWIGDPSRGRPWRQMHDQKLGEVFNQYENYSRVCPLPGTDGLIWSDYIRGIILHLPLRYEDLPDDAETIYPPVVPTDPNDEPSVDPEEPEIPPETPDEPGEPTDPGEPEQPPADDEEIGGPSVEPGNVIHGPFQGDENALRIGIIWEPNGNPLPPMQEGDLYPSIEGTRLAELIEACPLGGFAVMNDLRLPEALPTWPEFITHNQLTHGDNVLRDNQTWGSKGFWDRRRLRSFQISDRTPQPQRLPQHSVFTSYVAAEHLFTHAPLTYAMSGTPHPYCHQALDDQNGKLYYMPLVETIFEFDIDLNRWGLHGLKANTSRHPWQAGACWHEGLGMLLTGDGNIAGNSFRLRGWRPGMDGWADMGELGHNCYHTHFRYGRVLGLTLVLGGNHNPRRVTIIDRHGQVHHMADHPSEIDGVPLSSGMANTNISEDPLTGNFLLADQKRQVIWEYNPLMDRWALGADFRISGWPGKYYGNVLIPISGTDAILWSSGYQPRIYRHKAVLI